MVILFANIKKRLPKLELLDSLILERIKLHTAVRIGPPHERRCATPRRIAGTVNSVRRADRRLADGIRDGRMRRNRRRE